MYNIGFYEDWQPQKSIFKTHPRASGLMPKFTINSIPSYFLKGLIEAAESGLMSIKTILSLQSDKKELLWKNKLSSPYAIGILNFIFINPYVAIKDIEIQFDISFQSASTLISQFEKLGILKENTGRTQEVRIRPVVFPRPVVLPKISEFRTLWEEVWLEVEIWNNRFAI